VPSPSDPFRTTGPLFHIVPRADSSVLPSGRPRRKSRIREGPGLFRVYGASSRQRLSVDPTGAGVPIGVCPSGSMSPSGITSCRKGLVSLPVGCMKQAVPAYETEPHPGVKTQAGPLRCEHPTTRRSRKGRWSSNGVRSPFVEVGTFGFPEAGMARFETDGRTDVVLARIHQVRCRDGPRRAHGAGAATPARGRVWRFPRRRQRSPSSHGRVHVQFVDRSTPW